MRKSIDKRLKVAITAIASLLIAVMVILIVMEVKQPGVIEEKTTILSYDNKADVQYKVMLKPNPLYDADSLGEDQLYITAFVDHIKTNYQYEFNIDDAAEIKGNYKISAIVEGYIADEKKDTTIWKKEFVLQPETNFTGKNSKASIKKEVAFNLAEYDSFAMQIRETAELNTSVRAILVMNINLKAVAGKNVIEKKFMPSVTIPLSTNYFTITKSGVADAPEFIEDRRQIPLPVNRTKVTIYSVVLGLACLGLLYVLIFVKGDKPADELKKQLDKIFKTHGSRFVAINSEVGTSFAMYYRVKSMEDLVRIADELGKPIMYRYSAEPKEITNFYVHDDRSKYAFNVRDVLPAKEEEIKVAESGAVNTTKEIPME